MIFCGGGASSTDLSKIKLGDLTAGQALKLFGGKN